MSGQLSKHSLQTLRIESNNHLYFAHWELFRIGILTVFTQEDEYGKREIVRMLKAIYSCPDKYSSGSPSVPTPYHMQWLCAKLLEEIQTEKNYLEDADFKLLLLYMLEFTNDCFIQDIYKVFWINAENENIISETSLNCYSSLININPQLAAELLKHLMTRNIFLPHFQLAEVFLNHLQSSLQCVCKVDVDVPEQTAALLQAVGYLEKLVEIGRLHEDFEVHSEKLKVRIDKIVSLLKTIGEFNENLKTKIFFLLLPEQNTWILKKINVQMEIQTNDVFLKRVFGENMVMNIKELCLETLETRSHFLERILKCCLHLVEVGKLDIVLDVLKPPLLERLWPLIYILSWENVRTVTQVRSLLDHSPVISVRNNFDPLLMETCRNMCQDAKLALWCLQNRVDSKRGDEDAKIVEILQDLAAHSPLFVINKVLGLNHLGKEDIVQALVDHSSCNNPITYSASDEYLHILNGYYIMKLILEAVCSGQEMDYLLRKKCHRILKTERLGQVASDENIENLDEFYQTKIKTKLKQVQSLISEIFPLPFRIQLLEDAFSLLFLQNKYLDMENDKCEMLSDEGSQGEENAEKRGKSPPVMDSSVEVTANGSLLLKTNGRSSKNKKFTRRTRVLSSATTTTSSSCGSKRDFGYYGKEFVCSPFVVRDLLFVLKETVLEADISVRKHHHEVRVIETSRDPPKKSSDLSRIATLSKFISDAVWRLHITTSERWLESEAFTFSSRKYCDYFTKIYPDSSCKVPVVFQAAERDGSSTDDESKNKSRISHEVVRRCSRLLAPQRDTSVIRLMLSSQESLVYMCLHRNQLDLVKAEQAIKMFNMRDSDCAHEVKFMKGYKRAAQQLCISNQPEKPTDSLSVKEETFSPPQPMRKLSQVAGEAIKAALATEIIIVDELLSMYPVPFPVMSNDTLFQNEDTKNNFSKALVISDLVTVSECDINSSLKLLTLAKERLPKSQKGNKTLNTIRTKVWGFLDGLTRLAEAQMNVSGTKPCFGSFGSLNELISSWCWSLDWKNFKKVSGICWKMNQVLESRHEILDMPSKNYDLSIEEHPFNVLVRDVNEMAVELAAEFIFELLGPKSECRATAQVPCYLRMILDYANSLKSLLGKCGGKEEELGPESSLSLLRLPQKEIIKKLLQNPELTADKLQEFATQSKLDLASLIIQQCTPRLSIYMDNVSINSCEGMWKNGHYVLNGFSPHNQDSVARHPDVVITEILQDTIVLMKGMMEGTNRSSVFSYEMALEFCQTPSCWQVLGRSQELGHVDLTSLHSTNQQTAFLTNVANLLTLHSLLFQFRHFTTPSLLSPQSVLRMAAEEQFAYRIGQLGIVSLLDLKKQILRSEECSSLDYASTLADVMHGRSEIMKVDPRLVFAMSNGTVHSPKLQVLCAERLDDQLVTVFHEYLLANLKICMDTPKIQVPQLVFDHISELYQQSDNIITDFLTSDIVPQQISEAVAELQKTHLISNLIHIEPFNYKFCYIFDYNSLERVETNEDIPDVVPSSELQCPSEAVFEYLATCCPLAATLTNILQENGVESGKLQTDFPVLHRYLQQRVVTAKDFYAKKDVHNAFCSKSALADAWLCFDALTEPIQVDECLRHLEIINAIGYWRHDNVLFIEDVVLENIVASLENDYSGDNCPWNLASRIRDETRRARCVLRNYGKWPPDAALQCLTLCRNLRNVPKQLRCKLSVALTKLTIYEKVCSLVKNGEVNLTGCSSWVIVEQAWLEDPGKILDAFFVARKFQLVVDWADSHKITEPFKQLVEECRVLSVLGENIVDPIVVKSIADSIPEPLKVSDIFLQILPYVKHLEVQLHIANFLLEEETVCCLLENDKCKVWERKIAIQIMLCVPEGDREDYRIFLDFPLAFVEQLLINMKMEILQKAILAIRDDLVTCPSSTRGQISLDTINNVLEIYAGKAIDFKVVYRKPQATKSASSCMASTNPSKVYVKPAVPPKKQDWVPDSEVTKCMVCKLEPFSMFNRRHHCRRCGRVVCAACSQNRAIVKGYQEVFVRVCDECLETSTPQGNETASRSPSLSRFRLITSSHSDGDQSGLGEDLASELQQGSLSKLFPAQRVFWKLSGNSSHDVTLREEFFYEQAPSVPLCLSILDLHSDQGKCATFSLRLVRNTFHLLLPIGPGTANREIDYSLTISMTLSLLLSAKVNFSKACLWDQVNECDSLLGLADIFKLLVAADCQHLMPYGDLDDPDILRRLRDRLMEEEIWKVALEVSTKSGQDVDSVLVTWAMFCLRSGQLDAAREKFSRCLRKSHDGYHATLNNLTLPKILDCLDSLTSKSAKVSSLQTRLQQIKSGNLSSNPVSNNDGLCETLIWNESIYYLNMYGTHKQFLNFYLRKQRIDLALQHIIDKKCDVPIFLDGIWKPAVESGKMKILLDSLNKYDSSLAVWSTYISGLCGFLERRKHWNQLYFVQKFCKDHIRAAFTCIHFYKDTGRTYLELYERLQHLANARVHFEKYLSAKTDPSPIRMQLPRQDIHRHINAIEMQIQVTKFLHRNWNNTKRLMTATQSPPTAFDSNAVRALLAALVLIAGSRVEDGFGIAYRIIQEFHLKADKVYSLCAKKLVQHGRLADVPQLVDAVNQSASADANICDVILMTALDEAIILKAELQDLEMILKLLTGESSKIQAFIKCGKLKSAYLLAVKRGSAADVQLICSEATRLQQTSLQNICQKWLIAHNINPL